MVTSPKLIDPDQIACAIARLFYPRRTPTTSVGPSQSPPRAAAFSRPLAPHRSPSRASRPGVDAIVYFANSSAGAVGRAPSREGLDLAPVERGRNRRARRGLAPSTARRSSCPGRLERSRCRRHSAAALRSCAGALPTRRAAVAARRATISAKILAVSYEYPDPSGTITCTPYPPVVLTSGFNPISSSKPRTVSATVASVLSVHFSPGVEIEDDEVRLFERRHRATSRREARSSRDSQNRPGSAHRCRRRT